MKLTDPQKKMIERTYNGELGSISEESKTTIKFVLSILEIGTSFKNGQLKIEDENAYEWFQKYLKGDAE